MRQNRRFNYRKPYSHLFGSGSYNPAQLANRKKANDKMYEESNRLITISKSLGYMGCWRFLDKYRKLDGDTIHIKLARGEGEIVRHLCCDNRCVNIAHIKRGTELENAKDEIVWRNFGIIYLENELGEKCNEEGDVAIRYLVAKYARVKYSNNGIQKSLTDVYRDIKELYRLYYEAKLAELIASSQELSDKLKSDFENIVQIYKLTVNYANY
jgi:hypothetical protein